MAYLDKLHSFNVQLNFESFFCIHFSLACTARHKNILNFIQGASRRMVLIDCLTRACRVLHANICALSRSDIRCAKYRRAMVGALHAKTVEIGATSFTSRILAVRPEDPCNLMSKKDCPRQVTTVLYPSQSVSGFPSRAYTRRRPQLASPAPESEYIASSESNCGELLLILDGGTV